jgi:hypothetical protein
MKFLKYFWINTKILVYFAVFILVAGLAMIYFFDDVTRDVIIFYCIVFTMLIASFIGSYFKWRQL